jgi:capsular polysaccharide biosynthesis protein
VQSDTVTGFYTLDEGLQRVRGWVLNRAEPARSQWVEILADKQVVSVLLANLERGDLAKLNTGYTCYGFEFLFPAGDAPTRGVIELEVRHKASGICLPSDTKAFRIRKVSQTDIPVRDIDHLQAQEITGTETTVPIDSQHWHGDPQYLDQLIGCNGKTARRVGKMRAGDDGNWEYTKTVRYYRIRDAMVVMPFGMIIAEGSLIRGNVGLPHPQQISPVVSSKDEGNNDKASDWLQTAKEVRLRVVEGAVRNVDRPALLMSAPKYQGYNHWHVDALPMLAGVLHLPADATHYVIGPGCPTTWHAESLNLAKSLYPDIEYAEFGELGLLRVKELVFTTGLAGNGCYLSPQLVAFYRQLASLVSDGEAAPGVGKRLYLSRRAYPRRALLNEAEIEQAVESLGFRVIDPATYPYEEQIRLFRQAEFIVSPHGAALTNLVYSREGVKVIELFPDCYINLGLQRLANLKKTRYGYMVGKSSGAPAGAVDHSFAYSIDAGALAHLINEMDG